jgi:hypothetical protein
LTEGTQRPLDKIGLDPEPETHCVRSRVMDCYDPPEPSCRALDTAARYFAASGRYVADRRLMAHLIRMFNKGERRWLVLANRAIECVEQELESERTFIDTSVVAFSREIGKVQLNSPGDPGPAGFDWLDYSCETDT